MVTLFNITISSGQSILYANVYNGNFTIEALSDVWYRAVKRR